AKSYLLSYRKTGTNNWKGNWKTANTFFTLTNLNANKGYDFSAQAVCKNGIAGAASVISFITTSCTPPSSISKNQIGTNEEQIIITNTCPFDTLYCRYGTTAGELNLVEWSTSSQVILPNLQASTKYFYQVSTCRMSLNDFTMIDSFTISASATPNIILIILD